MNAKRSYAQIQTIKSRDALPELQMDRGNIVSKMGHPFGELKGCSVLFAHELIHRANAYPKLTLALEACAAKYPQDTEGPYADARALLKALGE